MTNVRLRNGTYVVIQTASEVYAHKDDKEKTTKTAEPRVEAEYRGAQGRSALGYSLCVITM